MYWKVASIPLVGAVLSKRSSRRWRSGSSERGLQNGHRRCAIGCLETVAAGVVGRRSAGAGRDRFAGVVESRFSRSVAQFWVGASIEQVPDSPVPTELGGGEEGGLALVLAVVDVRGEARWYECGCR